MGGLVEKIKAGPLLTVARPDAIGQGKIVGGPNLRLPILSEIDQCNGERLGVVIQQLRMPFPILLQVEHDAGLGLFFRRVDAMLLEFCAVGAGHQVQVAVLVHIAQAMA